MAIGSPPVAFIGYGAVARAVVRLLAMDNVTVSQVVIRPGSESRAKALFGDRVELIDSARKLAAETALVVDCAGHPGLRAHGETVLRQGFDLITVASGALADERFRDDLTTAATAGHATLRLASGAIGALDALGAAAAGKLENVTYRGRKPPSGWRGSPAEVKLDLDALTAAATHFRGSARTAALEYPKNANVAASVALAGVGFDQTIVELIADPGVSRNIHEVVAEGDFGRFEFRIEGESLPDNPSSSAVTAMSVVHEIRRYFSPVAV